MNLKSVFCVLAASLTWTAFAAVPPAEQLLPADTLLVFTVPDWTKASAAYHQSPTGRLWQDPEVKAFKDKFLTQFQSQAVAPLEKELGVKLADYADLLQGQVSFAFNLKSGENASDVTPGWCLLIDSRDKSDQLKKSLADLKKKWTDSGKPLKTEKLRDIEFTTLTFTPGDLKKTIESAFPQMKGQGGDTQADQKVGLTIGQSDSLLLLGSDPKDLEKILARQSGGQTSSLAEQSDFQSNQSMFRDSVMFGWLNLKPLVQLANKKLSDMAASAKNANPMMPKPDKVFAALGLSGLKTLAFSFQSQGDGSLVNFVLNVPEANRKGLFKAFTAEAKNANPPSFIPADVAKFNRYRVDGQKTWATIESMVAEVSPELSSLLQMGMSTIGKDKDPNFDLKKTLIGNLGDDFIQCQKVPKSFTLEAVNSPPSLWLIGSPNAEQLAAGLKTVTSLAVPSSSVKEREFLGRKVYALPLPSADKSGDKTLSFTASGGYLALSTDDAFLEEYLRSSENKPKALEENAAVKEASQKVGGMSTGVFGYENQAETARTAVETMRQDKSAFERLFALRQGMFASSNEESDKLKAWLDFSLLPPFDKIAKYFYFTVYSATASADGIGVKVFSPVPPELKK